MKTHSSLRKCIPGLVVARGGVTGTRGGHMGEGIIKYQLPIMIQISHGCNSVVTGVNNTVGVFESC